jgi:hypothetical protein
MQKSLYLRLNFCNGTSDLVVPTLLYITGYSGLLVRNGG